VAWSRRGDRRSFVLGVGQMEEAPVSSGVDRRLPRRVQLLLLGASASVALLLFFGLPLLVHLIAPKAPPAAPAPPAGQFVATDQQWATLAFATARTTGFTAATETDGKIAADDDRTTQVFSPFSGRVGRVLARVGDKVRTGQPLFTVQASEYVQGRSDLATTQAQLKVAKANESRLHELYKTNGAALKDWQQSQSDLIAAEAALASARSRLRILGIGEAQINALAQAAPSAGEGSATAVRSPISGVVTQRSVGEGQTLASVTNGGSTPSLVVSDLTRVWLVGELREADAPKARVGQALVVKVTALPDREFQAKINFVSPTVDPVSHRVAVRAEIENPDGLLKPEMFATFSLVTGGTTAAVGVPEDAVVYEGDTARVWVAHPEHRLELRQIRAGQTSHGTVEVLSGLTAGEQVVTSGALFIDRASKGD
jgi:cobalt-zinc-cadmium efflux system membrane fusion protein